MVENLKFVRKPIINKTGIYGFFGEYRWLSNFHLSPVTVDGMTYNSAEHAFMAMKTFNPDERKVLSLMSLPVDARRYGQTVKLRPDWERVKVSMMKKVLQAKFHQDKGLGAALLATDPLYLEETNDWGDVFWGVSEGKGQNNLGRTIMEVRDELKYN